MQHDAMHTAQTVPVHGSDKWYCVRTCLRWRYAAAQRMGHKHSAPAAQIRGEHSVWLYPSDRSAQQPVRKVMLLLAAGGAASSVLCCKRSSFSPIKQAGQSMARKNAHHDALRPVYGCWYASRLQRPAAQHMFGNLLLESQGCCTCLWPTIQNAKLLSYRGQRWCTHDADGALVREAFAHLTKPLAPCRWSSLQRAGHGQMSQMNATTEPKTALVQLKCASSRRVKSSRLHIRAAQAPGASPRFAGQRKAQDLSQSRCASCLLIGITA
jgi:hypothetical protein